jgi:hypothetical protein
MRLGGHALPGLFPDNCRFTRHSRAGVLTWWSCVADVVTGASVAPIYGLARFSSVHAEEFATALVTRTGWPHEQEGARAGGRLRNGPSISGRAAALQVKVGSSMGNMHFP